MKYTFNDIFNEDIYSSTKVMFVVGKYTWFNNMICDTLKELSQDKKEEIESVGVADEFGLSRDETSSNSVDFNTFFEVIGVGNINGKWYCRVEYSTLTKKQLEKLLKYIKEPSENGILIVTSEDWLQYKDLLKNRVLSISESCHIFSLSFPNRNILKEVVKQSFSEYNIEITEQALNVFLVKMNKAYNDYEDEIKNIADIHKSEKLELKEIKEYMKGINHYDTEDFIKEIVKPMVSDKTNSKKVLKIMSTLLEEKEAKDLVKELLKKIENYLEFRVYINKGTIPVSIKYFFNDVKKEMPDKYKNMNEWKFRNDAYISSLTSIRDWQYMKLILLKGLEKYMIDDDILNNNCKIALYELCTRSILTESRINNIIGIDNIIYKNFYDLNKVEYIEI